VNSILCFNSKPCPFRKEYRGHDDIDKQTSTSPRAYYRCGATTIEQMQPCLLEEDTDLQKYATKVLVKDSSGVTKAWDPKKVVIQRLDRAEMIDGGKFEV
jgi:hypothetical protein